MQLELPENIKGRRSSKHTECTSVGPQMIFEQHSLSPLVISLFIWWKTNIYLIAEYECVFVFSPINVKCLAANTF